ncbi:MAG: KH domain-containing protein [Anaerolineae bacterium]|nr:KH domain-containing protein [Anaerolineae bacterium]
MKELIEYIADQLVEDKSQVSVTEMEENGRIRIELKVAKDDMGRVIGKGGRVANSIRVLLRVAAARENKRATLDIVEP